ncbi:MAG: homoserine kinase, partial [Bacillota bacterium]
HQPYRCKLIPGIEDVWQAAKDAGALSAALSGAGPCVIAFTVKNTAQIGAAMQQAFLKHDIQADILALSPDCTGAIMV